MLLLGSAGTGSAGAGSAGAGSAITFVIDGGGSTILAGIKGDICIPFDFVVTSVQLLADQTGSIIVDIWKDTYANYPPTVADKITGSTPPTISAGIKSTDSTLTEWTTTIEADSILRFNVNSVTSIQRVTVILNGERT
jgi:hypothetical protein